MIIKLMHTDQIFEDATDIETDLALFDRYLLMRAHPRRIVFDIVGAIWATFFLWNNNLYSAILVFLVMSVLGIYFVRKIDPELMSQTTLGKMGLIHKNPINLILNVIGIIPTLYGLWMHDVILILTGLSMIILGHFFGWSKVNSKFRMTED